MNFLIWVFYGLVIYAFYLHAKYESNLTYGEKEKIQNIINEINDKS